MEKFIFLIFVFLLSAQSSLAQQIENDEERAEWISNNFINLGSLCITDVYFDFAPLRSI
jgi:hypothetical protein